jgi:hypothetical protein
VKSVWLKNRETNGKGRGREQSGIGDTDLRRWRSRLVCWGRWRWLYIQRNDLCKWEKIGDDGVNIGWMLNECALDGWIVLGWVLGWRTMLMVRKGRRNAQERLVWVEVEGNIRLQLTCKSILKTSISWIAPVFCLFTNEEEK